MNKILTREEYDALGATYDPGEIFRSNDEAVVREHLTVEVKRKQLKGLVKSFSSLKSRHQPIRMIDIGCGMGGYLLAGQKLGFDVLGVEPSEDHSAVGREFFDLPIISAYFDPADFVGQAFDIIILSHVIEHIFDPVPFIEGLASIVAPGGILVVITPNSASTIAKVTGGHWSMLGPIDHVTMMTPQALATLTPEGFRFQVSSTEMIWEPAVVFLQAIRNIVFSGRGEVQADPTVKRNNFRSTAATINGNLAARFVLSLASSPIWLMNLIFGRSHCLTGLYHRETT